MALDRSPAPDPREQAWHPVCRIADLELRRGVVALVHGQAVALFRTTAERVYALSNRDPFSRAALAREVVGERDGVPFVGSPTHGHAFDLRTGCCLDDAHVRVATFAVEVRDGVVRVGPRRARPPPT